VVRCASTALGVAGHSPSATLICWSAPSWTNRGEWIWLECELSLSDSGDGPTATRPSTTVTTVESPSRRTSNLVPIATTSADPANTRNARSGSWATSKSAWPDVSVASRSVLPKRMVIALSVFTVQYRIIWQATTQLFAVTVSKCSAVVEPGADTCAMG